MNKYVKNSQRAVNMKKSNKYKDKSQIYKSKYTI